MKLDCEAISMYSFRVYCVFMFFELHISSGLFGRGLVETCVPSNTAVEIFSGTDLYGDKSVELSFAASSLLLMSRLEEEIYYLKNYPGYTIGVEQVSFARPIKQEPVTSYEGAQVWRIKLRSEPDFLIMQKLIDDQGISIWKLEVNQADFLIKPEDKVKVNRLLSSARLNHTVVILDVQRRIDALKVEPAMWNEDSLRIGHRLNWKEYPTLGVIDEYLNYIAESYPSISKLTTIGYTAENRTIKMLRVSNGNPDNKIVLIISGEHAREWISITSALYVLDMIVARFDQLPRHMKAIEWIIIPVLNPDGYEYSHTHNRLWRKNRRKLGYCRGVDINRNFNIDWDISGMTNKNECNEDYPGFHPFSEAESIALRNFIISLDRKPTALLDLHSYGQFILYPWGGKSTPTPDRRMLWTTSKSMAEAIFNKSAMPYRYGAIYHTIHPARGTCVDWMYTEGVTRAFVIELRDSGNHGFLLPAENIEPTGNELLAAVRELAREIDPEALKLRGNNNDWF